MKKYILNGLFTIAIMSFLLPTSALAETNDLESIAKEDKENNISVVQKEFTEGSEDLQKGIIENNENNTSNDVIDNTESTTPKDTIENNTPNNPLDNIENNILNDTIDNTENNTPKDTIDSNIITVSTEEEFRNAVLALNAAGGEKTIILNNDINLILEFPVQVNNGTLTILGNGHTLSVWRLDIEGNATINLGKRDGSDKLTLTSNTVLNSIVYLEHGAELNMYEGVTLKDSLAYGVPGAVYVTTESTFNMYGGLITNCSSNPCGGGIMTSENSTFNMYGGTITNNTSDYAGGGVSILDGTFNMTGGEIYGNSATMGGGVIVFYSPNNKFSMTGGAIHNNTALVGGDDIVAENSDNLELNSVGSGLTLISDGKQITDWYYDGGRSTDEVDENGEIIYDETRWNASEVEEDQYLYKYTKPGSGVMAFLKAAHGINDETDYTVVHEYYTNGVKDGEVKVTDGTGNVGSVIKADDIEKLTSYDNNNYKFTSANPSDMVLSKDGNNIIKLRYDRTIQTNTDKPANNSNNEDINIINTANKIDNLNPANPQTGDTTNIALWFILLLISGTVGVISGTYNFKYWTK